LRLFRLLMFGAIKKSRPSAALSVAAALNILTHGSPEQDGSAFITGAFAEFG